MPYLLLSEEAAFADEFDASLIHPKGENAFVSSSSYRVVIVID